MVRKTYKYKLMPTPDQEKVLETVLWRCRTLYNCALEQRKTWWGRGQGIGARYYQQKAELPDLKDACPEYHDIYSQVLQDVLLRLDTAFQAFFRRIAAGEQPGYPRFQGRNRYNSFTYPQVGEQCGARVDGKILSLAKVGRMHFRRHRPMQGIPKTVTIVREADGWYACISCADVPAAPLPATGQETGIDVGLKVFLITTEGDVTENPRHYRKAERELQKAQRRLSRREKGSKRRKKAAQLVARKHQKVKRQRRDFHHKTALDLVRAYDTIYLEDLQVSNMIRRPAPKPDGNGGYEHNCASQKAGLNKSIQDAGWGQFRTILEGKAAYAGRRVVAVPPAYTSQDCSGCGERVEKSLSTRTHVCPSCGLILDRDENAARNIQWAGQALRGVPAAAGVLN
jgi:putative transposase